MRLICGFVAAAVLAGCVKAPPPYESRYTGPPPSGGVAESAVEPSAPRHPAFDVASVDAALASGRPYEINVLGDSTGNNDNEWVHLIARRIANNYGRAVTVHDWSLDTNAYVSEVTYGVGAPVTIWNGSAPGRGADYSAQQFPAIAPEPPDVTIISHGHNNPNGAVRNITALINLAYTSGTRGVVVLTQNPILPNSIAGPPERAELEANTFREINTTFNNPSNGTVVIDVFSAFPTGPELEGLLVAGDGVHPNAAGEQLWADTVAAGLRLR